MEKTKATFTPDQVASINAFQTAGMMHPFTCGNDACRAANNSPELVAETSGLKCPHCDYTQDWVHGFMADWSWKKRADAILGIMSGDQPDP